jgi:integrase
MTHDASAPGLPNSSRPTLRIVRLDDSHAPPPADGKLSADSTLTEVYYRGFVQLWLEPHQADPKTAALYLEALHHWRTLTALPDGSEPWLWQIDDFVAARFVSGLQKLPGCKPGSTMSIGTMRKHITQINKLLDFSGPRERTRHGRRNLGLIEDPPLLEKPTADLHPPEGDWTIEEVRAMWLAAAKMVSPSKLPGVKPVEFWHSIVMVAAYTALRRGQLLGLAYADLAPPFITVRSSRSKGRRGKKQYLHEEAIEAIESIRTPRDRIFAWPHVVRHLDTQLRRLAQLANIPAARRFGWNGFRKCAATLAYAIAGSGGSKSMLGHSREGTGLAHYVNGEAQARSAAVVIDQMPSPKPPPAASTDVQGLLF